MIEGSARVKVYIPTRDVFIHAGERLMSLLQEDTVLVVTNGELSEPRGTLLSRHYQKTLITLQSTYVDVPIPLFNEKAYLHERGSQRLIYIDMENAEDAYWLIQKYRDTFSTFYPEKVSLLTRDETRRIKAAGRGILVETPRFLQYDPSLLYKTQVSCDSITEDQWNQLIDVAYPTHGGRSKPKQPVSRKTLESIISNAIGEETIDSYPLNTTFIIPHPTEDMNLAFILREDDALPLNWPKSLALPADPVLGVRPKNDEQAIALYGYLLNPSLETVIITGEHGSGKTLLALAAAFSLLKPDYDVIRRVAAIYDMRDAKHYVSMRKIILLKPNVLMGDAQDIGALPGTLEDKLEPILKSYADAHAHLSGVSLIPLLTYALDWRHPELEKRYKKYEQRLKDIGFDLHHLGNVHDEETVALNEREPLLEIVYSGFARGRTFSSKQMPTVVLIDEAQNFTPEEMLALLQRMGESVRLFITGDPFQVDRKDLTPYWNGLIFAISALQGNPFVGTFHLLDHHRSRTASIMRHIF